MKRPWRIWLAYAACVAAVAAAMGWISRAALRLERAEARADRRADFEERVRLALWRMDSAMAPVIAGQSARPYFAYTAFHPVERAYTRMFAEIRPDEVLLPSPLLTARSPAVRLHFQIDDAGTLSSPQVPRGNQRDLAETGYTTHDQILADEAMLERLSDRLDRRTLLAALPAAAEHDLAARRRAELAPSPPDGTGDRAARQQVLNDVEYRMRQNAAQQAWLSGQHPDARAAGGPVREGPMQAVRMGGVLLLARRVRVGPRDYVQGCWLNWEHLHDWLLATAADLLPAARLVPVADPPSDGAAMLASLPVRLVPGELPGGATAADGSPLHLALGAAWLAVLVATLAVGLMLRGAVVLSERRAAFVSAVTHELRTPLTTFRLYADLLAAGSIADPDKRTEYVKRLQDEADRLGHLVENVLAYSRLTGTPAGTRAQEIAVRELLARAGPRLAERCQRAGMEWVVEEDGPLDVRVQAAPEAVERILQNLVDNACKYAGRAADRRIHLRVTHDDATARVAVRDHGPGVTPVDARRLFRPFHKSAAAAAASQPGVGLGLALSRRLARDMGGDLQLDPQVGDGACFVLVLRIAAVGPEPDRPGAHRGPGSQRDTGATG